MDSALNSSADCVDHENSCEALHPGQYYTSTYYEESQTYSDNLQQTNQTRSRLQKTGPGNAPIEIREHSATVIDLPPIEWHGYETAPKILKVTNTGRTISINGQWLNGRPYILGGPLNGNYIFSQIHFHSPSEHEIGGIRYPLEMHVVHYKTSYLTQERAMREKDGTVVVVYLFQVSSAQNASLPFVEKLSPEIEVANKGVEITDFTLSQIVHPFSSKYYVYWGSVTTEKNSYLLQWVINSSVLYVNEKEAHHLLRVINSCDLPPETPRVNPEDDAVFYVEEYYESTEDESTVPESNVPESNGPESNEPESNEPDHCNICHLYEEECYSLPTNSECPKVEGSETQHGSKIWECLKSCSKLRKCKSKKTKKGLKSCCNRTTSACSCQSSSQTCITFEGKKSKKITPINRTINETSNSSVSTNIDTGKSIPAINIACSCPSVSKCTCNGKSKEKKKKVKTEDKCGEPEGKSKPNRAPKVKKKKSGDYCVPAKESKKSRSAEKTRRQEETSPGERKCSTEKTKKEESPKKSKNKSQEKCCEHSSEAECHDSKSSEACKEKEGSKTDEDVIECMFTSLPGKSFDEILSEYDTTLLVDSKLSSDLCGKEKYTESVTSKSQSVERTDTITTIYEKKRSTKPPVNVEDCTVNFLLTPSDRKSSSLFVSAKSLSDEMKNIRSPQYSISTVPDVSLNKVHVSEVKPRETLDESAKELCVQVELMVNSEKSFFPERFTQEYNFALMYNQNILQEYKGVFRPERMLLGNYEKLELVPKYPEPDSVCISVQDSIIKMEALDTFCMRAKFLLKEVDLQSLPKLSLRQLQEKSEKKITMFSDAVTQCSVKALIKPNPTEVEAPKQNSLNQETSEPGQTKELVEEPKSPPVNILSTGKEVCESVKDEPSLEQIFVRSGFSEDKECKAKIVQNPVNYSDVSPKELCNSSEQLTEGKKSKEESSCTKKTDMELNELFSNKKKTVYFMCDKIGKDEKSRKSMLLKNFRSQEEVEDPPKVKKLNSDPTPAAENVGNMGSFTLNNTSQNSTKEIEEGKVHYADESKSVLSDGKELITVHKFKPKNSEPSNPKKDRLKLVVGRVLNQLDRDSESFRRLADLVGFTKTGQSKISVYELQQPPENNPEDDSTVATEKENLNVEGSKDQVHTLEMTSKKNSVSKTFGFSLAQENQKVKSEMPSQNAVIVIPIEVESLSKVEVILVEHRDRPDEVTENIV